MDRSPHTLPSAPPKRRTRDLLILGAVVLALVLAMIFLYARARHSDDFGGHHGHHGHLGFGHDPTHRGDPGDYYGEQHSNSYSPRASRGRRPPPRMVGPRHSPPWRSWCWRPCPEGAGLSANRLCRSACV